MKNIIASSTLKRYQERIMCRTNLSILLLIFSFFHAASATTQEELSTQIANAYCSAFLGKLSQNNAPINADDAEGLKACLYINATQHSQCKSKGGCLSFEEWQARNEHLGLIFKLNGQ